MTKPRSTPPPPPPGSERRKHERFDVFAQVQVRAAGAEIVLVPVVNISAGGVAVAQEGGQPNVKPRDEVAVYMHFGDGLDLAIDAEVVRIDPATEHKPSSVALMWTSRDPATAQTISRILEFLRSR